jgi:hypothetical protein
MSKRTLEAEIKGLEAAGLGQWGNQKRFDDRTAKLQDVDSAVGKVQNEIGEQKIKNGKHVAVAVKAASAEYQAAFKVDAGTKGGAAATGQLRDLFKDVPDGRMKGTKKPQQPEGMSMAQLQAEGVKEAAVVFGLVKQAVQSHGDPKWSSVCKFPKSVSRAAEKAETHGDAGLREVTDFGRLTIAAQGLENLKTTVASGKAVLEEHGYEFVLMKNTLDLAVDTSTGGGFRNLHTLIQKKSGMVIEIQWTLSALEQIKHSPIGHLGYEVMRKSGLTSNTTLQGNFDTSMADSIICGQALELDLTSTSWTKDAAAELEAALLQPECRVQKITLDNATGDGLSAAGLAMVKGTSIQTLG